MYRRGLGAWAKHLDFMALDLLCMQVAFALSYWLRLGFGNPYATRWFQYQIVVLAVSQLLVVMFTSAYSGILRRGPFAELSAVVKDTAIVLVVAVVYLFVVHDSADVSRLQFGLTLVMFIPLSFLVRQLNKRRVIKGGGGKRKKSMVAIASSEHAERVVKAFHGDGASGGYAVSEVLLLDDSKHDGFPTEYCGVPARLLSHESLLEISRGWVDEFFILQPDDTALPVGLVDDLMQTGVTVDFAQEAIADGRWPVTDVREVGGFKVLTAGAGEVTPGQILVKRLLDIAGGLVGCAATAVLFIFVAPAIYFQSPGPIFFKQERVGRNGKTFLMYKFRSMYPDAEERKAELAAQNKVGDGMMFKVEGDPRIIGSNKVRRDGSPGGIGNFIRRTSIDEFPQFFNVLKGDMSLVGTRPPTLDEWSKYSLWHRSRMGVKPGITGLWQVSGRSQITDFDEVVRLDRQYIQECSLLLDFKILLKTVVVVLRRKGAE